MGEKMYGWETVWVKNCMGEKMYGWETVWVKNCMGEKMYGWETLWVKKCMGGKLYGRKTLWVGTGENSPLLTQTKTISIGGDTINSALASRMGLIALNSTIISLTIFLKVLTSNIICSAFFP